MGGNVVLVVDKATMEQVDCVLEAYIYAKGKHPHFADNANHAVSIMAEELGEVARAVNDGDMDHAKKEAAQLAAVCLRFLKELSTN